MIHILPTETDYIQWQHVTFDCSDVAIPCYEYLFGPDTFLKIMSPNINLTCESLFHIQKEQLIKIIVVFILIVTSFMV